MDEDKGALDKLIEGGLPQIIAGPAGKAVSRLIGAGVDIPVEWLAGISQGIRDKREARTKLSQAVAVKASQIAVEDPALMERALHAMLGKEYRRQKNKEAVAAAAIEHLDDRSTASAPQSEPADDWMNLLERVAEDASTDSLRQMFGMLLADEIRAPGAVSKAALHMVSVLDNEAAQLIDMILPFCDSAGICYLDCMSQKLNVPQISLLEHVGFWSSEKLLPFQENVAVYKVDATSVLLRVQSPPPGQQNIALLSRAGQDLRRVLTVPIDHSAIARHLYAKGAGAITKMTLVGEGADTVVHTEDMPSA